MSEIMHTRSPFDAIRSARPDGTEYWSARAVMPLLGYEKWERFEEAIERATISCAASGQMSDSHFSRRREASPRPGLPGRGEIHRRLGGTAPIAAHQQMTLGV